MLRLVIATPFLENRGGMERVVLKIAQHYDAKIHCLRFNPEHTFPGFSSLDIEASKPGLLSSLPLGKRLGGAIEAGKHFYGAKLDDYDLINAHQTPSEWIRNKNSPVIWYCHTPNREAFDLYEWRMGQRRMVSKAAFWASIQAFRHFEFKVVPKIEYIFTNSKNSQARIRHYLRRESEVLYPGVEHQKFRCRDYENFFFYPSRIAPEKELEYAIEAFKLFKGRVEGKRGFPSNWKLVIAGSLSGRPEHREYFKKIKSLCGGSIEIRTNVEDSELLDLYSRCYGVLYTPINEDYGLVPLEALASGKPCIARNEGGPRETIISGKDGYLVNSVSEMAEKMGLLAGDPELARKLGIAGRKKVARQFTWERFLRRFDEKAREVAKEGSG